MYLTNICNKTRVQTRLGRCDGLVLTDLPISHHTIFNKKPILDRRYLHTALLAVLNHLLVKLDREYYTEILMQTKYVHNLHTNCTTIACTMQLKSLSDRNRCRLEHRNLRNHNNFYHSQHSNTPNLSFLPEKVT